MIRAIFYFILLPNFSFHISRVRLKRKYLFQSRKKEIIILHSTKAHMHCTTQQNGSKSESTIETSGFEEFNNFVDMNGSNIDK